MPKKKTVMLGAVGFVSPGCCHFESDAQAFAAVCRGDAGDAGQRRADAGYQRSGFLFIGEDVFPPVSANVAQLPVAVGDNVSAGDLIVGYDLIRFRNRCRKRIWELTAARSGYHDSLNKSNEKADEYSQAKHDAEKLYAEANDLRSKVAGLGSAGPGPKGTSRAGKPAMRPISRNCRAAEGSGGSGNDASPAGAADRREAAADCRETGGAGCACQSAGTRSCGQSRADRGFQ